MLEYPPRECHRCVTTQLKASKPLLIVTLCLGPAVNTGYKQTQEQVRPVGRTIYVISAIMAVLIVAFLSIIVYLKVQHRKSALPQKQNTSSGSISKSTQSTVQQPSFDLKQSISEIKSCVFNQVSCVILSIASCVYYNSQLSKKRRNFGDQVLALNLCCGNGKLVPFPVATCRPLTSLAAKRAKVQATILLPLEMRKVSRGNTVSPKLQHQSSVASYSNWWS